MCGAPSPEKPELFSSRPLDGRTWGMVWAALVVIVVLFAIGQGSGALLPVHDAQHPGNHYDEVRLTVALQSSESYDELTEKMPWGETLLRWAYIQHHVLGVETTTARRLFSVALASVALLYLAWLLLRYRVLAGPLVCLAVVLWAVSATTSLYATLGLTPYTVLLLYSVIFVHMLTRYGDRSLTWTAAVLGGILFALMTFVIYRTVSGVGAVVGSLLIGELLRSRRELGRFPLIMAKYVVLGVPSLASALAYLYFFPPEEMLAPRRGFQFYFMLSEVPKTLYGAVYFAADRSMDLFISALAPPSALVGGPRIATLLGWGLLGLILVGFGVSLLHPRSGARRALGLAFLIGIAGHLALSFATIIPYGNMRYFLSFAVFFPLFAALGVGDLMRLMRQGAMRVLPERQGAARLARSPATALVAALVVGMSLYTVHLVHRNDTIHDRIQQGHQAIAEVGSFGLVLDAWTEVTLQEDHADYLERDHQVLAPNMRTQWRSVAAEDLAAVAAWEQYLGTQDRLISVTSLPFRERYYGPLFDEVAQIFQIEELTGTPSLHFARFVRKDPNRELLAAPDQLAAAAWRRSEVEVTPLEADGFQADFGAQGIVTQRIPLTVSEGDALSFSVELWAEEEIPDLRLMLKRGEKGPFDGAVETIRVGRHPQRFIVTHSFRRSWQEIEVGIVGPRERAARVYLRGPRLRIAATPAAHGAGGP